MTASYAVSSSDWLRVNKFCYHIFMYYECIRHGYSSVYLLIFSRYKAITCTLLVWNLLINTGLASLKPSRGMNYICMVIRLRKAYLSHYPHILTEPMFSILSITMTNCIGQWPTFHSIYSVWYKNMFILYSLITCLTWFVVYLYIFCTFILVIAHHNLLL